MMNMIDDLLVLQFSGFFVAIDIGQVLTSIICIGYVALLYYCIVDWYFHCRN